MSTEKNPIQVALTTIMEKKDLTLSQKMRSASFMLLPIVGSFIDNGGEETVEAVAGMIYDSIPDLSAAHYGMAAARISSVSRDDIKNHLAKAVSEESAEKALASVREGRAYYKAVSLKDHIASSTAFREVMPVKIREFIDVMAGNAGLTVEAQVKKARRKYQTKTDDQLVQEKLATHARYSADAAVDAIYAVTQSVTPAKLKTLVDTFKAAVSEKDFVDTAVSGTKLLREVLQASADNTGIIKAVAASPNGAVFKPTVTKILQAFEDSVAAAGLLPDTTAIVAAYAKPVRATKAAAPKVA